MTDGTDSAIRAGERAPPCSGVGADGRFYSFEAQCGRPAIVLLAGSGPGCDPSGALAALGRQRDRLAYRGADALVATDDNPAQLPWTGQVPPWVPVIDCGDFLRRCGVRPDQACMLVLDRNLRVAASPGADADAALAALAALPTEPPIDARLPAPVLMLPNLLPPDLCRDLIAWFDSRPSAEGEVARIDARGRVRSVVDHGKKRRRDAMIARDDPAYGGLHDLLLRRCAPEIAKAFQVRVAHTDRLLVARYDQGAGWFRRHRDNSADNVAFRQFAISVNLNAGAYQGGHLLFPEYNDHRYAPATGEGLVFSASLLHEATEVTRGTRYVLLTFFHDDAAEDRRCAYFLRHPGASALGPSGA